MAENLFGTEVPSSTDSSDGTPYTLGTRFTPAVNGSVTHIRWRIPLTAQPSGSVTFGIYQNSNQALLGSVTVSTAGSEGTWLEVALTTPVSVTAGTAYTTVVFASGAMRYVATSGYAWPKTSGNLSTPNPGGFYNGNFSIGYPNSNFGGANYFPDVSFTAAGALTPFTRDYVTTWRITTGFTRDYATTWRVTNTFQRDYSTTWRVTNAFTRDYATTWRVTAGFTRDYSTTWRVTNAFQTDYSTTWNVLSGASFTRDYSTTWSVRNALTRDYSTTWNVRAGFTRDYVTSWAIRNAFVRDYATSWSVLAGFSRDYVTSWSIRNAFTRDYVTTWNVIANEVFVRDYVATWNIRGLFQRDYVTFWNIFDDSIQIADVTAMLGFRVRVTSPDPIPASLVPASIRVRL